MSLAKKGRFKKKKKKDVHRRSDGVYGLSIHRNRKISELNNDTSQKQRFFAPGSDLTYSQSTYINPEFNNSPLSPLSPISPITPKTPQKQQQSCTNVHISRIKSHNTPFSKINNNKKGSKIILRPKRTHSTPNTLMSQQNKKSIIIDKKNKNNKKNRKKRTNIVMERAKLFENNDNNNNNTNNNDGHNDKLSPKTSVSYFDLINPFASVTKKKKRKLRREQSEINFETFEIKNNKKKKKNEKSLSQKYDYNNNIKSSMNGNVIYISSQSNVDDNGNAVKIIDENVSNNNNDNDSSSSDFVDENIEGLINNKNDIKKKSKINIWTASINYLTKKKNKNNETNIKNDKIINKNENNNESNNLTIPLNKKSNQLTPPTILPSPKQVNYTKIFKKDQNKKLKERSLSKKHHNISSNKKHKHKHKHKHFYPTKNNDSLKLVSVIPINNNDNNNNELTLKNINAMNGGINLDDNNNIERRESFSFDSSVAHSIIAPDSNENKTSLNELSPNLFNFRPGSRSMRSRTSSFSSIGANSVAPSVILVDKSIRYRRNSFDTLNGSSDEDNIQISEDDALMFDINEEIILAQMNKKSKKKPKKRKKINSKKKKKKNPNNIYTKRVSFV